jgi:hypothetical protein
MALHRLQLLLPTLAPSSAGMSRCGRSFLIQLGMPSRQTDFFCLLFHILQDMCEYSNMVSRLVSAQYLACSLQKETESILTSGPSTSQVSKSFSIPHLTAYHVSNPQEHVRNDTLGIAASHHAQISSAKCLQEPQTSLFSGTVTLQESMTPNASRPRA